MIPIAVVQCYDAVPSNRDFPLVSMETKDKLKRLQTMLQFDSSDSKTCVENIQYTEYFYDSRM